MQQRNLFFIVLVAILIFGFLVFFPFRKNEEKNNNELRVVASFYPLAYFAEEITQGEAVITLITPDGVEAHHFEPTPGDLISIRNAQIFFFQGGGFDPWAETVASQIPRREIRIINMIEEIKKENELVKVSSDGEEDLIDPHIWLDPTSAIKEVEIIRNELKISDPSKATMYEKNANHSIQALKNFDQEFERGLKNCQLREIVVSHDAFGYLAKRYQFSLIPLMGLSPEEEPSLERLSEVVKEMKEKNIEWFFVEPLSEEGIENTLQNETGAQSLILHPIETLTLEERREGKNYFSLMRENFENLKKAMKCSS